MLISPAPISLKLYLVQAFIWIDQVISHHLIKQFGNVKRNKSRLWNRNVSFLIARKATFICVDSGPTVGADLLLCDLLVICM